MAWGSMGDMGDMGDMGGARSPGGFLFVRGSARMGSRAEAIWVFPGNLRSETARWPNGMI